jgi:hypothetical protein
MGAEFVFSLFVAACATATPTQQRNPKNPFELYVKSVRDSQSHNVSALIDQHDPSESEIQTVKLLRDKRGRFHKTVVGPLRWEGVESVDDGNRWVTLFPDERTVQDQESPLRYPHDETERLKLAEKNYTFSYDGESSVAGRRSVRLVATPHWPTLETRRYFLDAETLYPLRVETVGDHSAIEFTTIEIAFPQSIDPYAFRLPDTRGFRVFKYDHPHEITTLPSAEHELGFRPILPSRLNLGFRIQEKQVSVRSSWETLVLRLTDGLVRATVYEFSVDAKFDLDKINNRTDGQTATVKVMVVASMPEEARRQLLDSFVQPEMDFLGNQPLPVSSLSRILEPNTGPLALANLDKSSPPSELSLVEEFRRATEGRWTL